MDPMRIARLVELACLLEVMALKPGNVNRQHDFSNTTFEDFIFSAWASGAVFACCDSFSVGQLVLQGVRATRRVVSSNTNLGILLLLAPLAKAAAAGSDPVSLRLQLVQVLEQLTLADARYVYTAIREAEAGGLKVVPKEDVAHEPTVSLLEAMKMSQDYDSIAKEYCTSFAYTFNIAFPALQQALKTYGCWNVAIVQAYLELLAAIPDTLIARKAGKGQAKAVMHQAQRVLASGDLNSEAGRAKLLRFDNYLRQDGNRLNPGTSADLITAAIFVQLLHGGYEGLLEGGGPG